jgi:hypothetical protein
MRGQWRFTRAAASSEHFRFSHAFHTTQNCRHSYAAVVPQQLWRRRRGGYLVSGRMAVATSQWRSCHTAPAAPPLIAGGWRWRLALEVGAPADVRQRRRAPVHGNGAARRHGPQPPAHCRRRSAKVRHGGCDGAPDISHRHEHNQRPLCSRRPSVAADAAVTGGDRLSLRTAAREPVHQIRVFTSSASTRAVLTTSSTATMMGAVRRRDGHTSTTGHVVAHVMELQCASATAAAMVRRTVRLMARATAVSGGWPDPSNASRSSRCCRQRHHRPVGTPSDTGANRIAHRTTTASCPMGWSNVHTATRPVCHCEHEKRPVPRQRLRCFVRHHRTHHRNHRQHRWWRLVEDAVC